MRGEFVRRMRSRGRNMKRRTNSRRQEEFGRDEHKSDFQHREREMEMEKREHEHPFQLQLERMPREHEIEMERLARDHKIEMHEHGFPHINFEPELPYDEMSDEQREKIQLVWFQLEQKKTKNRLKFGSMRLR